MSTATATGTPQPKKGSDSFSAVLLTGHYVVNLVINIALTVVINFYIDRMQMENEIAAFKTSLNATTSTDTASSIESSSSAQTSVSSQRFTKLGIFDTLSTPANVAIFCLIVITLNYFTRSGVSKRLASGSIEGLSADAFTNARWKRVLLFAFGSPAFDTFSFKAFAVQVFTIVYLPMLAALYYSCALFGTAPRVAASVLPTLMAPDLATGYLGASNTTADGSAGLAAFPQCPLTLEGFLAWTMVWKGVGVAVIYTMNYLKGMQSQEQPQVDEKE